MRYNPLHQCSKRNALGVQSPLPSSAFLALARLFLRLPCILALLLSLTFPAGAAGVERQKSNGKLIQVGRGRTVQTLADASRIAASGDTIEVDAGEYRRDVAVWTQAELTLKAINGRVLLIADGASAESKAIWVIRGGNIQIEGFDFIGAAVGDHNGAGIRLESGQLTVRGCKFTHNENGILTGGHPQSTLVIENSEFGHNGFGDGQSHNLYVGAIAKLSVMGSYFHHANVGHLLKSRAAESHIFYNRLTDESGGRASYELEFPNGGLAYVVGNTIQQSPSTENPNLISYGAEGKRWPENTLYLVNNTLVDERRQGGVFLRMKPGVGNVVAVNNLLVGNGTLEASGPGEFRNNFNVGRDEFVLATNKDYHLRANSKLWGKAIEPPKASGIDLRQTKEYRHPTSLRAVTKARLSPGAFQS